MTNTIIFAILMAVLIGTFVMAFHGIEAEIERRHKEAWPDQTEDRNEP